MHHLQPTSAWQASSVSALHLVSRGCGTPASFSWLELFALLLLLRREGGNITRGTAGRVATADRSDGARLTGTADAIIGSAHAISAATRAIPPLGSLDPPQKHSSPLLPPFSMPTIEEQTGLFAQPFGVSTSFFWDRYVVGHLPRVPHASCVRSRLNPGASSVQAHRFVREVEVISRHIDEDGRLHSTRLLSLFARMPLVLRALLGGATRPFYLLEESIVDVHTQRMHVRTRNVNLDHICLSQSVSRYAAADANSTSYAISVHTQAFPARTDAEMNPTQRRAHAACDPAHAMARATGAGLERGGGVFPPTRWHDSQGAGWQVGCGSRVEGAGGMVNRSVEKFVGGLIVGNLSRGEELVHKWGEAFKTSSCSGALADAGRVSGEPWLCRQLFLQRLRTGNKGGLRQWKSENIFMGRV